jgi:hypothetical protein
LEMKEYDEGAESNRQAQLETDESVNSWDPA